MSIELKMPALSPTMEKGTLARWLVTEGDLVKSGDLVAEVETDKATMEVEATDAGRVEQLVIAAGSEDVPVGTVIALLVDTDAMANPGPSVYDNASVIDKSAATATEAPAVEPSRSIRSQPVLLETHSPSPSPSPRKSPADRIKVSPLAQRIADAKGIDLSAITGTGPNGRITRADLGLSPAFEPDPIPVHSASVSTIEPIAPPPAGVPVETVGLSGMRRTIARRLTQSKQTVPHFYLTARCNLDPLLKLRAELNASLAAQDAKLSVNDMLIKALALALGEVPDANVQFGGDELHRFGRADISMAVALDGGLVTPVIKDAGTLSLSAISRSSKEMAAKARDGKLLPEDYQGGTASISNLGMYGIDEMFPVINPPQALILGVGAGVEQPWKVDGHIALATIMAATASFDHRAIDGATAAQFMQALRELIDVPLRLVA
ncbi:pyruvate dehydrogenase complex dihydrolipoamide acetyltransferase [Croceicoccus estronivorus]|uniref:pyruvate dehydrogenase complex dihydrolipoamide acetyltransferase n=1 Tax=Croceicoccus estronivorus TaxID=1172626 RepID=UPI000833E9FF|nr:pyruvate dehydrogenase complex dihydrolipoamide acetyltransferase [Croceicoccus estronivorus]OCC24353.1 pyruvate dehydrogenase complex dihydrolipoamide acetyltransferase [Croceicoccus estronivorus]